MKTKKGKYGDFVLVGHLQVFDEPLSSLYYERGNGEYYLFVRVFEENDVLAYILAKVSSSLVMDYMDGKVGLKQIFKFVPAFCYRNIGGEKRNKICFMPITAQDAEQMLKDDGLDDKFMPELACNSVSIRNYLMSNCIQK